MKHFASIFLALGLLTTLPTGCFNLKPTTASPRYFVLAPVPSPTPEKGSVTPSRPAPVETSHNVAPGLAIAPIKLPDYLTKKSVAIRKSANEVAYLESALWAERLDEGFLRVLTANIAGRLPGHKVLGMASRKDDLDLQLRLTVQQFDVNSAGDGVLTADWRIVSAAGGKTVNAGRFHAARKGPNPERDPAGAISTLGALVNDLSGDITKVIR
jgi:uncharacterized lipoprotein YmbA